MNSTKAHLLLTIAMSAFAGNSILCRLALRGHLIDANSFTSLRLLSGAATLAVLLLLRGTFTPPRLDLWAAVSLFLYAACFSLAYVALGTGTGALLLFSAVQLSMIAAGIWRGDRPAALTWVGVISATGGLAYLMAPGITAPPPGPAILMLVAGIAWGIYSLRGAGAEDPEAATTWNFIAAAPLALLLSLATSSSRHLTTTGIGWAALSGTIASGLGYVVWYRVLPQLRPTVAATVQLTAPMLAGIGGVLLLGEPATARLGIASVVILGGIGIVIGTHRRSRPLIGHAAVCKPFAFTSDRRRNGP